MQINFADIKHDIKHIAFVMDGNNRWAQENNLPITKGYESGANTVRNLLPDLLSLKIPYVTFYALSLENLKRPKDEVDMFYELLANVITSEIDNLIKQEIRLKVIGNLDKLDKKLVNKINQAVNDTAKYDKMELCIAFCYGGRYEIINACNRIISEGIKKVDEDIFKSFLYDSEMPDVDLFIRSSGTMRLSNFLLWQIAYAELYFLDKYWPDFDQNDLYNAVIEYKKRIRNFGLRDKNHEKK